MRVGKFLGEGRTGAPRREHEGGREGFIRTLLTFSPLIWVPVTCVRLGCENSVASDCQ